MQSGKCLANKWMELLKRETKQCCVTHCVNNCAVLVYWLLVTCKNKDSVSCSGINFNHPAFNSAAGSHLLIFLNAHVCTYKGQLSPLVSEELYLTGHMSCSVAGKLKIIIEVNKNKRTRQHTYQLGIWLRNQIPKYRNCKKANSRIQTIKFRRQKVFERFLPLVVILRGMRWHIWLRHCTTNRKVAGWIPDGVTGIFQWLNPSGRIVALGSTQPLNRNEFQESFLGVKTAGA
jgi:hypothetical protein